MSAGKDDARQRARLARTHLSGVACARDEPYEEAEESGLSAIELNPKEVGLYVTLASIYACARQYKKMLGVLRRAVGVDAVVLRAYLDDEPPGDNLSTGASRRSVNLPEEVEAISHSLLGVGMSRIASGEDKEAALTLEIALQLNPKNSPAVMLLTATYLLWGKGGEERGRTSALRNIPGLAEELFGR